MGIFGSLFGKSATKTVTLRPSGREISVVNGETVLERALKEGINYPHDCTVGTCGACRSRLVSGKVDAITPFGYTLSREELDSGYILACQAVPKTDLEIEIDLASTQQSHVTCSAKIESITPLTHDIMAVVWNSEQPISFKAGQYMNVRWNGGEAHRSYSFASAPEPNGSAKFTTFIRHVPGGAFTDPLFAGETKGYAFELDGPHGQFYLRGGQGPILCIAGGSGLAPIISLLQDAAKKRTRRDCVLLYGGRAARDIYCEKEIAAIRSSWTAGFDFWPILSETPENGMRSGFVTEHIAAALERLGPDAEAYMCGPPPMIDAAIAELGRQGVPLSAIHYDKFTDASTKA